MAQDADGGMSKYPGNTAGAKFGTGYCDAQCPHDVKFINGEANLLDWTGTDSSSGAGKYGTCCTELDIWESNKRSTQLTPHTCSTDGQYRCVNATDCGDNQKGDRFVGVCDKDGCDYNPYRMGAERFYGNGSSFTVDTSKPFTVVTEFHTSDKTDTGDLVEIRRKYVQGGEVIENPTITLASKQYNSISDDYCDAQMAAFNATNHDEFKAHGGIKQTGKAMEKGLVLVMSLWDDHDVNMLWLDSVYPPAEKPYPPGALRGPCSPDSGKPDTIEKEFSDAYVTYSNIKTGPFGSTYPSGGPSPPPSPPQPPGPPSPPAPPGSCPGGTLVKCMGLCPSSPPIVYKDCIADCGKRCPK